ncbi:MAG: nickel/cobalt transporter (NicO) family protein [Chloroflexota bacterium]|nr:nickel/cobalt transporter (NicO) family protein [Chloroflexota bacterium]
MRRQLGRRLIGAGAAVALAILVPAVALAHPLGNFTINHFAGIRVAPDRISLDVVIDRAEIPAFQEQQQLDTDGDGTLSAAEIEAAKAPECRTLVADLVLTVDGRNVATTLTAAGLSLPPGAGGLSTMRLVCEYQAVLAAPLAAGSTVAFEDRSFAERIGWREIVVLGDGVQAGGPASGAPVNADGVSARLTSYPKDLLTTPLGMRSASASVTPGGPTLAAWSAPDAQLLAGAAPVNQASAASAVSSVPGGITDNLAALVNISDLNPLAILVSLAIAFGLGVVHAVSPGHGKTIMAAYLVGAKGSSRQAVGLGLAVTISHTLGVLVLAGITLAASSILPPERLYPILGVSSGGLVILIGSSLLWNRLRVIRRTRAERAATHDHGTDHRAPGPQPYLHGHGHSHPHPHGPAPTETTISWRGLIALGLSGGLVPSASALILLLGSIAAGRVGYGLVLVLGFGLGMAVVLAGIGLLLVHARRLVERRPSIASFGRIVVPVQLATASLVVVLGIVLTTQAITQVVL